MLSALQSEAAPRCAFTDGLFPSGTRSAASPPVAGISDLDEAEALCVRRAVESRQREFATGRVLAHRLLAESGAPATPLLPGPERAPLWPEGFHGSISHTADLCVAAVAPDSLCVSLGLDVERAAPLDEELWSEICTPDELQWLEARPRTLRGLWATVFFSAKESVYKCVHPRTGVFLEFHDVELGFAGLGRFAAAVSQGRFGVRIAGGPEPQLLDGRFASHGRSASHGGWIFTGVTWRHR